MTYQKLDVELLAKLAKSIVKENTVHGMVAEETVIEVLIIQATWGERSAYKKMVVEVSVAEDCQWKIETWFTVC